MEDVLTAQTWHFRYRFWPNNKSRMYLLEGTGEFVKSHLLREGDLIQIYRDVKSGKHIILAKKLAKTKSHVKTAVERTTATTTIMTTTAAASHKQVEEDCLSGASTVSDSSIDQQKKRIGCKINARKRKIFAKQDPVPAPSSGGKTNSGGGGGGGGVVEKFPSVEMEDEFIDEILGMVDADEPSSPESCKEDD